MYQETVDPKSGKLSNSLLIVIAVIVIFIFEPIAVWLNSLIPKLMPALQALFVMSAIAFCIWFYRKRLRSVRYTLITDDNLRFPELVDKPESVKDFANGSFFVESIVGSGAGTYMAVIRPEDIKGFYDKGITPKLPERFTTVNGALSRKEDACSIVFEQDGETTLLYINPSDRLKAALTEMTTHETE